MRVGEDHAGHFRTMRSAQQPVGHLAHDRRLQQRDGLRCVEQAHQAQRAVRQRPLEIRDEDTGPRAFTARRRRAERVGHFAHDRQVELQDDAEERLGRTGLGHAAERRGFHADDKRLARAVIHVTVAEHGPFRALHHDAQRGFEDQVRRWPFVFGAQQHHAGYVRHVRGVGFLGRGVAEQRPGQFGGHGAILGLQAGSGKNEPGSRIQSRRGEAYRLLRPQHPEGLPVTNENTTNNVPKIAIVTGGSRGLGRSTVIHLAQNGVDSIFTYRENQAEAAKVVAAVEAAGRRAIALPLDTGVSGSFDAFVERATAAIGELGATRFGYLVNNAGQSLHKAFNQTTEDELDGIYNVHFKGVYLLTQKLLPLIADGGRIVNVSSGLARVSMPGSSAYGAMKGAVEVLTRYMAAELGPRGIAVNTVAPGAVATDFSGGMVRDTPEVAKRISDMTALGRVVLPDDLGAMISSLLSDDNRWISGQRIEVSG